ncbi:MAG: rhomboid family intramembrane serine protease [Verrucomicrobia bacterium]|nr:rhomboid family intramembrane serine protease [Verrucomicrobiota bacterium]
MTTLPDQSAETGNANDFVNLAEAGVYATADAGFERGLVVLAMGLPYWLIPSEGGFRLLVEPCALPAVGVQLRCFEREAVGWPPRPLLETQAMRRTELVTPMLWCLSVLATFWLQAVRPEWTDAGALEAQAIFGRGEWWRPITALFLHADSAHVTANTLGGLFVFSAVLTTLGRARGWVLLTLASIAGNVAVAALRYPGPDRSVGASTAVFAGLGLLTGRAIGVVRCAEHPHRWRAMFGALGAGLTVLALYGAGGMRVDVAAHVAGFGAGLVAGCAVALRPKTERKT